jgi:hypothetical protein
MRAPPPRLRPMALILPVLAAAMNWTEKDSVVARMTLPGMAQKTPARPAALSSRVAWTPPCSNPERLPCCSAASSSTSA